ncbi:ArsR family transcriptional regulator [Salinadaptatus halalkaliphilus]|uniref:ArsR family transcriptional regulator n=2 Tax=Salinadaptatus halalkaliphilus TaxID=2419781 RepID=A0A4S3TIH7_9EURY|nr:ArsR family transcriptional regulator [Salinadaptatus halalkaliphilus]
MDAETIGELLEDEYARSILAAISVESLSAEELAEECDASPPTVYRRLNRLQEHDLIDEEQIPSPDGHHYRRFSARLEQVTIELQDGSYAVSIERTETDAVDRFTKLYEGLR